MLTKSSLSTRQKQLIETMQKMNFGRIEGLLIRDGEPIFEPPPRVTKDVKFGSGDNSARPELAVNDFVLKREHIELFEHLQQVGEGRVESIEVKGGLPFRLTTVETRIDS
ncbi:MAG: hypothetical protein M3N41_00860 [Acidobacteriota bacterium]|nr:hypothetical protein [Acidobacteriota bacterium]